MQATYLRFGAIPHTFWPICRVVCLLAFNTTCEVTAIPEIHFDKGGGDHHPFRLLPKSTVVVVDTLNLQHFSHQKRKKKRN